MMPPFDPRMYVKMMFYSIVFILVCTYLFANENGDLSGEIYPVSKVNTSEGVIEVTRDENVMSQKIKDRWVTPDGQWCFVTVVIKQEGDKIIKKEELHCSDTKFGITKNEEIEKLKKQIELEKAKKPGYWELFAAFYYKDDNAPLYCRKYARPDSWFKRPGTACLQPNGEWKIIR
jgi:hypothetical protein|tara:strand:- start:373 stop:897 length:525 start_codon:yes stop_codon:yes gene_type:complete